MPAVIIHGEEGAVKSLMDKYMEHKGKVRAFKVGEVANWGPEMCEIIEVDGDDIFAKLGPNKGWYTKEEINNLGLDWRKAEESDMAGREVTAKKIDDVYYPNYDDYKESFWKNNYEVKVTENGITFIVNADNEQEAFDYIIDYCEEKLPGLVSSYDELKEDGYNDQEMEDFIQGGNHGLYLTTHYVNLHEIGERKAQKGLGGPRLQDGGVSTCVCPKCGYKIDHDRGKPCLETDCPKCGAKMLGERKADLTESEVGNARTKLEDVKLDLQEWLSTVKRKYQTSGRELPESIIEKAEKANSIISNMMAAL